MSDKMQKRKQYMQAYIAKYRDNHHDVKLSFTKNDYTVISKIAEKQGMRTATFMRKAIMEQAKHLYLFPKEIEDEIKIAVRIMRTIGNNINQIAKYCNEQWYSSPENLEVAFNLLRKLEAEVKSIKEVITAKSKKYKNFNI
jgi:predicted transcriptional regulator